MSAATRALVEGWDAYSVAQARAYLLREAASALLLAQTKGTPGDRVVALSTLATRCIERAADKGKTLKVREDESTEASFLLFVRKTFALDDMAAAAVVERVKFDARTLRGQLDLFDKPEAP